MVEPSPPKAPAPNEARLVEGLRRGDPSSFDQAYETYSGRLYSFLLRLSGRHDIAEDLSQETWLKLARAAPTLREDTRLGPFLFTVARNAFVSHRRWAVLDLSRLVLLGFDVASGLVPGPDEAHQQARDIALLETALQALPVASREVLLLVGVEGLDQETVAAILAISYDAVRQRLSRARTQLSEKMASLERQNRLSPQGAKS